MNPRMLEYYNQELQHIRESAAEFAAEFPKIASRLTLSGIDCADPYVERLLEGFAYLSARVHLKLDAEYRQRQSLWFDLQILWRTAAQVWRGSGVSH